MAPGVPPRGPLRSDAARIRAEERELAARLPGYAGFMRGRSRLVPLLW